jgi:hypothetical protein
VRNPNTLSIVKVLAVVKLLVLLTVLPLCVNAQSSQTEEAKKYVAKQKGLYIYQFLKNIEWPKELIAGDLIVGVYGDENIFQQLSSTCSGKFIGNHKIKVVRYISATEVTKECHLLYVSENKSSQVGAIHKKNGSKTTIIGNKIGLLSSGAIINFIIKANKLQFEINKTNAEKSKLTFSQLLSKLAVNVI